MTNVSKFCCGLVSDTDALRYRSVTGPRKPVVVWNCTRVCNLKCRHCYAAVAASEEFRIKSEELLNVGEFVNVRLTKVRGFDFIGEVV